MALRREGAEGAALRGVRSAAAVAALRDLGAVLSNLPTYLSTSLSLSLYLSISLSLYIYIYVYIYVYMYKHIYIYI